LSYGRALRFCHGHYSARDAGVQSKTSERLANVRQHQEP